MADHYCEFPFEEIRDENGDYFPSWKAASEAGYDDDQIWSITESEGTYSYGPPHHYINHVGHVATKERHDGETYYHEEPDEVEQICDACQDDDPDCPTCGGAGVVFVPREEAE